MGESVKKMFGDDAPLAMQKFGKEMASQLGLSEAQVQGLGQSVKALQGSFQVAGAAVTVLMGPLGAALVATLGLVAAWGAVKNAIGEANLEAAKKWLNEAGRGLESIADPEARKEIFLEGPKGQKSLEDYKRMAAMLQRGENLEGVFAERWKQVNEQLPSRIVGGGGASEGGVFDKISITEAFKESLTAGLADLKPMFSDLAKNLEGLFAPGKTKAQADKAQIDKQKELTEAFKDLEAITRMQVEAAEDAAKEWIKTNEEIKKLGETAQDFTSGNRIGRLSRSGGTVIGELPDEDGGQSEQGFFGSVATGMGQAATSGGGAFSATVQGFATGGIAGAVVGLLESSKQFGSLLESLNEIFQMVADAAGQVIDPLLPIIRILGILVRGVLPALTPIFKLFELAMRALFPVIKYVGLGVLYVVKAIGAAWNWVIEGVKSMMMEYANMLATILPGGVGDTIKNIFGAMADGIIGGLAIDTTMIDGAITDLKNATMDSTEATKEKAAADRNAAQAAQQLSESLTNIPQGYKVRMAQYMSADAEDGLPHFAAGGIVTRKTVAVIGEDGPEAVVPLGAGGRGAGGGVSEFHMHVHGVAEPKEVTRLVLREMERRNVIKTGSPISGAPAFMAG